MAKFAPTEEAVDHFIDSLKSERQRQDARHLLQLFETISGQEPVVWYPGIIGFGHYRYKLASGREGDSPLLAFAPRQSKICLYTDQDLSGRDELLKRLGKHKLGVGCVYINKLADIDLSVLEELLIKSLAYVRRE